MNLVPRPRSSSNLEPLEAHPQPLDLTRSIKFAAIDIGSNAIRLLLSRVFEDGDQALVKKESLIRMPIRLGQDAFLDGRISDAKADQLVATMRGFRCLIDAYHPVASMACATSAMREAANSGPLIARVREQTGIEIQLVDGKEEAQIIFSNHRARAFAAHRSLLYIDVGGGSCELTLFSRDQRTVYQSYKVGTVRFVERIIAPAEWKALKKWIKHATRENQPDSAIGSGGNINKVFQLARQKVGQPLSYKQLDRIYRELKRYSFEERIRLLGLKPDRADVILPACKIYLDVMRWSGLKTIFVPQIGLADGMIHVLYDQYRLRRP